MIKSSKPWEHCCLLQLGAVTAPRCSKAFSSEDLWVFTDQSKLYRIHLIVQGAIPCHAAEPRASSCQFCKGLAFASTFETSHLMLIRSLVKTRFSKKPLNDNYAEGCLPRIMIQRCNAFQNLFNNQIWLRQMPMGTTLVFSPVSVYMIDAGGQLS